MKEHPIRFFEKYQIKPRQIQLDVLDQVKENWDRYNHFALSCPTGTGKTFIATAIAASVENAYILTSTLQLQTQYEKSWVDLVNLKGRGNYTCQLNTNFTVDAAPCSSQPDLIKMCIRDKLCSYYNQKDKALKSQSMITNPVYMLYSTHCGFANDEDSPWVRRSVLIIDECVRGDAKIWLSSDTQVTMAELYRNHNITHVRSFNEKTNTYEQKRILRRMRSTYNRDTKWIDVYLNVDGKSTILTTTENHKYWTKNRGYVKACELTLDDILKFDTSNKIDTTLVLVRTRGISKMLENRKSANLIKCKSCKQTFQNAGGFVNHQKFHLNSKFVKCLNDKCQKEFERPSGSTKSFCNMDCYSSSTFASKYRSEKMITNNPMHNPIHLKTAIDNWKYSWENLRTEKSKNAQLTRFKNAPLHQNRIGPNKFEQIILDLKLDCVKFTGLGDKWVTFKNGKHKNPDFIVEGTNKVIEVGDIEYWHTIEEIENVKQQYSEIGYECLYLTGDNLSQADTLVKKFIFNHDVKITKINHRSRPKNFNDKTDHFKYDIEVEDNHNYFANSILISNCHKLEEHLVQFAESDVDPEMLQKEFGINAAAYSFTGRPEDDYMLIVDLKEELMEKAEEMAEKIKDEFPAKRFFNDGEMKSWARGMTEKVAERVRKLNVKAYQLDKAIQPLKIFFNTHDTPEELSRRWMISKYSDKNVLKLAPIYGDFLFTEYFGKLADKFVFLSATLGSKNAFCKEIGIPENECFFIETDSPFPSERSPIIVMPSIKLSKDVYSENVKKVGGIIDDILSMHKNERGVCHCVTYDLQTQIFNRVSEDNRKRFLCRDMDTLNGKTSSGLYPKRYKNIELLELHESEGSEYGSVLLSPSMMEGIDLYDDLSRFQIIIKLPWANLGDARIKLKSQLDSDWYTNKVWVSILQASGRSTRNETDSSITYVLDEKFVYFYKQWEHKLPRWFKDRLVF